MTDVQSFLDGIIPQKYASLFGARAPGPSLEERVASGLKNNNPEELLGVLPLLVKKYKNEKTNEAKAGFFNLIEPVTIALAKFPEHSKEPMSALADIFLHETQAKSLNHERIERIGIHQREVLEIAKNAKLSQPMHLACAPH